MPFRPRGPPVEWRRGFDDGTDGSPGTATQGGPLSSKATAATPGTTNPPDTRQTPSPSRGNRHPSLSEEPAQARGCAQGLYRGPLVQQIVDVVRGRGMRTY